MNDDRFVSTELDNFTRATIVKMVCTEQKNAENTTEVCCHMQTD